MRNGAANWFGGAGLGQNYGNRRRYGGNPYPVSQESTLPSRDLTDEQLEDWEAEHGTAPPGSHDSRPHPDFPRETSPEVMPWVDPGLSPSSVEAPIPTTPMPTPAPIAPVTTVTPSLPEPTPALPEMVEGPPVATRRLVSNVSDEDLMDTYLEKVDGLCQIGEEYTRNDAKDSVRRPNINRAIESVLSSVPYYDRQRVKDLAKEECPEFGELDWALYFFGEEGPGAPEEWAPPPVVAVAPAPKSDRPTVTTTRVTQLTPTLGPTPLAPSPTEGVKTAIVDSSQSQVQPAPGRGAQPVSTPGGGGGDWQDLASLPASVPTGGGGGIPTGGGGGGGVPAVPDIPMGPVDASNLPSMITGIRNPMTARVGEAYPVVNQI